jgi:excisionase family DNA binding protein
MAAIALQSTLPEYVDVATLATRTGVAKSTWRQYISQGRVRMYRLPGGQVRVKVSDALALFSSVEPRHNEKEKVTA